MFSTSNTSFVYQTIQERRRKTFGSSGFLLKGKPLPELSENKFKKLLIFIICSDALNRLNILLIRTQTSSTTFHTYIPKEIFDWSQPKSLERLSLENSSYLPNFDSSESEISADLHKLRNDLQNIIGIVKMFTTENILNNDPKLVEAKLKLVELLIHAPNEIEKDRSHLKQNVQKMIELKEALRHNTDAEEKQITSSVSHAIEKYYLYTNVINPIELRYSKNYLDSKVELNQYTMEQKETKIRERIQNYQEQMLTNQTTSNTIQQLLADQTSDLQNRINTHSDIFNNEMDHYEYITSKATADIKVIKETLARKQELLIFYQAEIIKAKLEAQEQIEINELERQRQEKEANKIQQKPKRKSKKTQKRFAKRK